MPDPALFGVSNSSSSLSIVSLRTRRVRRLRHLTVRCKCSRVTGSRVDIADPGKYKAYVAANALPRHVPSSSRRGPRWGRGPQPQSLNSVSRSPRKRALEKLEGSTVRSEILRAHHAGFSPTHISPATIPDRYWVMPNEIVCQPREPRQGSTMTTYFSFTQESGTLLPAYPSLRLTSTKTCPVLWLPHVTTSTRGPLGMPLVSTCAAAWPNVVQTLACRQ
jgi:hypothetical protein